MIGQGHLEPATPEAEQQAQTMMTAIEEFLYAEEVQVQLVEIIGQGDPAQAIGNITGELLHSQIMVAESQGIEVSRDILLSVGGEVINALIGMGMEAGVIQVQGEEQIQQLQGDALIAAVDSYMSLGDEGVNQQAATQLAQQAMGGQLDGSGLDQGMMGGGAPPQGMPPQGMPPEGMPPEGMPPQQGMIGGMV